MFKGKWNEKFTKILVWVSAYLNFVVFALIGGYLLVKGEEKQKRHVKNVLCIFLIILAVTGFLEIFYNFASMSNNYYGSGAQDFYEITTRLLEIAKICTYATFIIIELVKNESVVRKVAERVEE